MMRLKLLPPGSTRSNHKTRLCHSKIPARRGGQKTRFNCLLLQHGPRPVLWAPLNILEENIVLQAVCLISFLVCHDRILQGPVRKVGSEPLRIVKPLDDGPVKAPTVTQNGLFLSFWSCLKIHISTSLTCVLLHQTHFQLTPGVVLHQAHFHLTPGVFWHGGFAPL